MEDARGRFQFLRGSSPRVELVMSHQMYLATKHWADWYLRRVCDIQDRFGWDSACPEMDTGTTRLALSWMYSVCVLDWPVRDVFRKVRHMYWL